MPGPDVKVSGTYLIPLPLLGLEPLTMNGTMPSLLCVKRLQAVMLIKSKFQLSTYSYKEIPAQQKGFVYHHSLNKCMKYTDISKISCFWLRPLVISLSWFISLVFHLQILFSLLPTMVGKAPL